ncbi:MAG TPA: ribonuclease R [Gammaproteobacteria bacterium]|nr:ribonuclease R [Gammaproteobacteria bacterium]
MYKNYLKTDPYAAREAEKYSDPLPSREYILQCLDQLGEPLYAEKIIEQFGLTDEAKQEAFRFRLKAMERDGQLIRNRRGKYAIVAQMDLIRGRVTGHKDGFGFLIPDDGSPDLFLTPYQMRSLFPGDVVLARSAEHGTRGKREGVVVEILERNTQQLVGRYYKERNIAFVQPDHKDITQDIVIPPGEQGKAKHGQYVVIEIIQQPTPRRQAAGRVIEILGEHLSAGMEIEVAIRANGLPLQWPPEVKQELSAWDVEIPKDSLAGRKDLRDLALVTIDGADAKDFDDAVYCEAKPRGGWRLVVAIADVSHYVRLHSALDKEAVKRGNSVYFPGRVIPMLPEVLSNELCSLKPQVDRLCMVCDMSIDKDGKLIRYKHYDAVMRSRARLTYDEVSSMLEGKKKSQPALLPYLQSLDSLYKKLHSLRAERGALDFDTTETRIIFGKHKKIKEIVPVVRTEAHKIIEECMLIANVATARFLEKHKIPTLYRIHPGPNPDKLPTLQEFLKSVGLRLSGSNKPTPLDYCKVLEKITGRPDAHLIQTVLLRSLMQAVYSPINSGHFGLAYEVYTHFTSPIRRYPDLLVHRAIRFILQNKGKKKAFPYDQAMMMQLGEHCSHTERRADEATRDAVDWLKCHYMQDKLGKEYDGIISGVTGFGVFVELSGIYVEGLLHITSLKDDYYHFDPAKHALKGKRTGTTYRLGDRIRVLVARVNLDDKQIDFELG